MKQPLVLFDIDKTVIGVDYLPNAPGFKQRVLALQQAGWQVGLNSDTPARRIARLAQEWGCDGPLVVEKGNAIFTHAGQVGQGAVPNWKLFQTGQLDFEDITLDFIRQLRRTHPEYFVVLGDPAAYFKQVDPHGVDRPTVVINGYRQFGLSFFLLVPETMKQQDKECLLHRLANLANCSFYNLGRADAAAIEVNHEYSVVTINFSQAQKRKALTYLRQHYHPIVMVGDSVNDDLRDGKEPAAIHLAVGNACPEYKAICSFVAEGALTKGSLECIDHILQQIPVRS